jgi:ribosomal protein S27AE
MSTVTVEGTTREYLARQLEAERERADYAWRNTRTIEAARAEEMRKRDAAEADNARLRTLAKAVLDTRSAEAKAAMTMENAQANYQSWNTEAYEHEMAMVAASEAERALRDALATPNAELRGASIASVPLERRVSRQDNFISAEMLKTALMTPEQQALVEQMICPKCGVMTLLRKHEDAGMVFTQCSQCMTVWVLTANA